MKTTALLSLLSLTVLFFTQNTKKPDIIAEIEAFNQKHTAVTLHMDNAAVLALWADDGITLLPGMAPVKGKKAITQFMDDVTSQMKGWKVTKQEDTCHDIEINGDWANEWCDTYQVVHPPDGKPVIESFGKMLLVLHREKDGRWLMKREMWNQGMKPVY